MASAPALSRLNGLTGWHAFQFMDRREEAQFREMDFHERQRTDVGISVVQLIVIIVVRWLGYDFEATPLGEAENFFLVPLMITLFLLQISLRMYLETESGAIGRAYFLSTLIMWITIGAGAHAFGFVVFQADPIFLILFFFCTMCQVELDPGLSPQGLQQTSPPALCEPLALS